jgi:hypothetical protein
LPVSPLYDLFTPEDPIGNHILSFVGDGQYRFVGGVCKRFKDAYSSKFPEETTRRNISTLPRFVGKKVLMMTRVCCVMLHQNRLGPISCAWTI